MLTTRRETGKTRTSAAVIAVACALASGCRRDMQDQPKYKPLAPSSFFADGRSARPIPRGTVAQGELDATSPVQTGSLNGAFLESIPVPVTREFLQRGQERFNIYCSPCHGLLGDGDGMIARRGFRIPPSFHTERMRQAPPGYVFQVITNGYGAMPHYADQIRLEDRWRIVAYIRALQLSRNATLADVPADARPRLTQEP